MLSLKQSISPDFKQQEKYTLLLIKNYTLNLVVVLMLKIPDHVLCTVSEPFKSTFISASLWCHLWNCGLASSVLIPQDNVINSSNWFPATQVLSATHGTDEALKMKMYYCLAH